MAKTTSVPRRRGLAAWSTRDLLVTAVISLVAGLVGVGITPLWTVAFSVGGPLLGNALGGYIAVIYLLAPIVVCRPLAALAGALLASLAQVPFSPYGVTLVLAGLVVGVRYELGFAITRYRSYRTRTIVVIAAAVQLISVFPSAAANGSSTLAWACLSPSWLRLPLAAQLAAGSRRNSRRRWRAPA